MSVAISMRVNVPDQNTTCMSIYVQKAAAATELSVNAALSGRQTARKCGVVQETLYAALENNSCLMQQLNPLSPKLST